MIRVLSFSVYLNVMKKAYENGTSCINDLDPRQLPFHLSPIFIRASLQQKGYSQTEIPTGKLL